MLILLTILVIVLHLWAGYHALKLIKKRDSVAPFAVDIIVVLHGFISLITTLTVQKLLYPDEEENANKIFLRDGMTLNLDNPQHQEIYNKLKEINKIK